jgi:mono/diheme cytochrome c family protein
MADEHKDPGASGPSDSLHHKERAERGNITDKEMHKVHAQLMREKAEPTEGFPPTPIYILFIFAITTFWGGWYMAQNNKDFRADVFDPEFQVGGPPPEPPPYDPIAKGARLYSSQCATCHQSDGQGVPGVYPPLTGSSWVLDSRVKPTAILIHGLNGPIEVLGNTYNGNMPAVGDWSDRDISAVLTYIRQAWGNTAEGISEEQVAEARDRYAGRRSPWTADELLALDPLTTPYVDPTADTGEGGGEGGNADAGADEVGGAE